MSYICLFANENGVSVAGDSRITLQPGKLGLHFGGRKVFSDPQQNTVWCCCGLVTFGGVHYPSAAARMLRNPDRSLATALERIGGMVGPATRANSRLYRTDCSFHLLVGRVTDGKVDVRRLEALNGEVTIQRLDGPVLLEAGWRKRLYPEAPRPEQFAGDSLEQLNRRAVKRVQAVSAIDKAKHEADRNWVQTVGGNVRCASVPAIPGEAAACSTQR
ncbi:MAG: hypothetical protein LUF28_10100 [Clostridiales bacterium]|nr:hypothetical protein [Clostridiales bacterium]